MTDQAADQIEQIKVPVFETTWLQGVVEFEHSQTPDGGIILVYTLGNGHRYAIPLKGNLLKLTQQAVSPVVVASADQIPNGRGITH